jgi:YicC-like family, N-terminal region
MSVYSMTGFAHATHGAAGSTDEPASRGAAAGSAVSVELRSVNSRFLDLAFRLPDELRGLERHCATWSAPPSSAARSSCAWPPSARPTAPGRSRRQSS